MKKLLIVLLATIPLLSDGQATTGIKIGGGLYQLSGIESEYLLGYEAGFYSKAELGKSASLLVELDYAVERAEIRADNLSSVLELNFVNVRFSGAWDFSEHFFLAAGPSFSYMIHPIQKPQLIPKSYFTHFAVGLNPCVGYETMHFSFLLRYEIGLTVLTLESTPEASDNLLAGTHFNGLKLIAGVKF